MTTTLINKNTFPFLGKSLFANNLCATEYDDHKCVDLFPFLGDKNSKKIILFSNLMQIAF